MAPKSKNRFINIRSEKKALILSVAQQLFANEGFFKTAVGNISKHSGISKGLMYNYFESKDELLPEIVTNKTIIT